MRHQDRSRIRALLLEHGWSDDYSFMRGHMRFGDYSLDLFHGCDRDFFHVTRITHEEPLFREYVLAASFPCPTGRGWHAEVVKLATRVANPATPG